MRKILEESTSRGEAQRLLSKAGGWILESNLIKKKEKEKGGLRG